MGSCDRNTAASSRRIYKPTLVVPQHEHTSLIVGIQDCGEAKWHWAGKGGLVTKIPTSLTATPQSVSQAGIPARGTFVRMYREGILLGRYDLAKALGRRR